jgi:cell division protein ZapA (FtsZ GTPase activity inhibitor)
MPDEIQLLRKAKELAGQTTTAEQSAVAIFAALLIADAIRSSVGQLTQMLSEKGE